MYETLLNGSKTWAGFEVVANTYLIRDVCVMDGGGVVADSAEFLT